MSAPNLDDPLDQEIANYWRENPEGAIKRAREWTVAHANAWAHGDSNINIVRVQGMTQIEWSILFSNH